MIEFHDLDKVDDTSILTSPEDRAAGYVHFLPNGGWHAFRVSTDFERSGDGSLRDLDPGIWITNLPWEKASLMGRDLRHVILRSDGWLKMSSEQILLAAGHEHAEPQIAARYLSRVIHRIHNLALETYKRKNLDGRAYTRVRNAIRTRPSLASGLYVAHEAGLLHSKPSEKKIVSIFSQSHQLGMYCFGRKIPPEGHVNLSFRAPSLSYAMKLAQMPVPGLSSWKIGVRPEDVSSQKFVKQIDALNQPTLYRAIQAHSGQALEILDAFTGSNRNTSTYRSLFLPEEIDLLRSRAELAVEAAIAGTCWVDSSMLKALESLIEVCGGRTVAAHSWSANLLAENILASAFRGPQGEVPAPESIWLAARDRCAMYPVIEALYGFGATLVSAQYGAITMQCPADPEMLSGVIDTAWSHGYSLPMGEIAAIKALSVEIPTERESYGGNPVDYGLCAIAHVANKKALLVLDGVLDLPANKRQERMRAIFS